VSKSILYLLVNKSEYRLRTRNKLTPLSGVNQLIFSERELNYVLNEYQGAGLEINSKSHLQSFASSF